jgi:hypothetical protein
VWEEAKSLPFPKEVKPIVDSIDWDKHEWQCSGLPILLAKYCLTGNELYLEELPNGKTDLKKEDFTGNIIRATYLVNPDSTGDNFIVSFRATFLKGALIETELKSSQRQSAEEYHSKAKEFSARINAVRKRCDSYWYRFLYKPYKFVVLCIATPLIWILMLLREAIIRIALFLTPI